MGAEGPTAAGPAPAPAPAGRRVLTPAPCLAQRFAAHHDVHVWFVAHPKQLQQWKGEPPGLYDISGSAHFVNKARAPPV